MTWEIEEFGGCGLEIVCLRSVSGNLKLRLAKSLILDGFVIRAPIDAGYDRFYLSDGIQPINCKEI